MRDHPVDEATPAVRSPATVPVRSLDGVAPPTEPIEARLAEAEREIRELKQALESRDLIGQAKGLLMAQHGIDAHAAFDLLVERSQQRNDKLRTVAAEIVEAHEQDPRPLV